MEARDRRLEEDSGFEVREYIQLASLSARSFARHELLDICIAAEHVSVHFGDRIWFGRVSHDAGNRAS